LTPPTPMSRASSRFARWSPSVDPLVAGGSAWAVTVAWAVSERLTPLSARVLAVAAIAALVLGALVSPQWPRVGRLLSIWTFVLCCASVWALVPLALLPGRLDPAQGAVGSLAWGLFAISWGAPLSGPPGSPSSRPGEPRAKLPRLTLAFVVLGLFLALVPALLAFWVPDRDRALFAQASALVVAAALASHAVPVGARVGEELVSRPAFGARRVSSVRALLPAAWPLFFLIVFLLLRAGYLLLR
jgi:hypothetical protein